MDYPISRVENLIAVRSGFKSFNGKSICPFCVSRLVLSTNGKFQAKMH